MQKMNEKEPVGVTLRRIIKKLTDAGEKVVTDAVDSEDGLLKKAKDSLQNRPQKIDSYLDNIKWPKNRGYNAQKLTNWYLETSTTAPALISRRRYRVLKSLFRR